MNDIQRNKLFVEPAKVHKAQPSLSWSALFMLTFQAVSDCVEVIGDGTCELAVYAYCRFEFDNVAHAWWGYMLTCYCFIPFY